MVVYHGTDAEFDVFKQGHKRKSGYLNFGDGFYFTPSKSIAEMYVGKESGKALSFPTQTRIWLNGLLKWWMKEKDNRIVLRKRKIGKRLFAVKAGT